MTLGFFAVPVSSQDSLSFSIFPFCCRFFQAKLDMPNGAHQQPGAGTALQGQELYQLETPVEGESAWMNNNMDRRDAAFEEILHLVHDSGIGIDGTGGSTGALPAYQNKIRAATNNAKPTWAGGRGLWAENERTWYNELKNENSLTQEYLASVIDVYYGLWWAYGKGMWGIYKPHTRPRIETLDPQGYALVPQFFAPRLTWMVMLHPSLTGTFTMTYTSGKPYTHKSKYYDHASLLGTNSANIIGNGNDNCLGPNAGTNVLDGMAGTDVVLFQGTCSQYSISCDASNACTIVDNTNGRDGRTTTKSIEHLAFRDGDYDISARRCTTSMSATSTKCWKLVDVTTSGTPTAPSPPPPPSPSPPPPSPSPPPPSPPPPSPPTEPAPSPPSPTPEPPSSGGNIFGGECKNSSLVRFRYNGRNRSCQWLSSRRAAQDRLCGHGSAADMACIKTCQNCGILNDCWEDRDARHYVNTNKKMKTCSWLSSRPYWQRKLCRPEKEAYYVCRETCNTC